MGARGTAVSIQVRVLIVDEIGLEPDITAIVFAVVRLGVEADGYSSPHPIIQVDGPLNFLGDWKCHLAQEGRPPGAEISGRNAEAKSVI